MRASRFMVITGGLGLALALSGCGPSKTERTAKERARLELEKKAGGEAKAANQAITGMNQKLGRKAPDLNLGVLPPESKTAPAPAQPKKP